MGLALGRKSGAAEVDKGKVKPGLSSGYSADYDATALRMPTKKKCIFLKMPFDGVRGSIMLAAWSSER